MKNFVTKTQTFYDHNMNPKIKQTDKSKVFEVLAIKVVMEEIIKSN